VSESDDVLRCAQEAVGYHFNDLSLLEAALTHSSVANSRLESNERLEFLGDAVLGLVVCSELYDRYGHYLEGDMTKVKSVVVSRRVCAAIADELDLGDFLFLGKGMKDRQALPLSLKAAVFESLIGAVYLDGGLEPARDFILEHILKYIEQTASSDTQQNYKSYLQQYAQKHASSTPYYETLDEQGPDHSKCFEVAVTIGRRRFPAAWGASKKEAEQKAAYLALRELDLAPDEEPAMFEAAGGLADAETADGLSEAEFD
jgi:ribonuclease-3